MSRFRYAHARAAKVYGGDTTWWPRSQTEATTLAWAVGLQWLDELHPRSPWWLWSAWGTGPASKSQLLDEYRVRHAEPESRLPASSGRRRFYPRQYLVDLCAGPSVGNNLLLTMESEVYGAHQVGHDIVPANGYAWDFAKLLYVRSPLRIFVARVGPRDSESAQARRKAMWASLAKLCASGEFEMRSPLVAYILAQGSRSRDDSSGGVWGRVGFEVAGLFT